MWKSPFFVRETTLFSPQGKCWKEELINRLCGRIFFVTVFHRNLFHIPQGLWRNFGVQNFFEGICTFLASPRKVPKEGDQGALRLCAPAHRATPLETPGAHLRWRWSTLTYLLFGQKVFRLFCPKGSLEERRQSVESGAAAISKIVISNKFDSLRYSRAYQVRDGRGT